MTHLSSPSLRSLGVISGLYQTVLPCPLIMSVGLLLLSKTWNASLENALSSPLSVTLEGGQSGSLVVYGSGVAVLVATIWALCERYDRRALQRQNDKLSSASLKLTEQHYRERLQTEERHLLSQESAVRNVHESLERMLLGKAKP